MRGGPLARGLIVERDGEPLDTVTRLMVEAEVNGLVSVTITEFAEVDLEIAAEFRQWQREWEDIPTRDDFTDEIAMGDDGMQGGDVDGSV